jgi:hypothetical protein
VTPRAFLELLWQFKPEESFVLLWTLPDKRSHWFRDIQKAAEFAAAAGDRDVYVGVGLSKADHSPARRCASDEISGITALWADLDLRSEAHGSKPLPATVPDALSVIPPTMPPTIVISTGNGAHAWWLLKEPYIFDTEEERKDTASLIARWHTLLRLNSASRGWAFDRLSDLARVLRLPGTRNLKDPANPKDVVVHSFEDRRYNLSDFEEFLDEAAIPDPEAQEKIAREWAERFADKPLAINPAARIPQDVLDGWMAVDMRFRNTWLRQRHDLKDQSQSGYDLALADFGVASGLAEQQIVDLIIQHRHTYSQKQRTKLDYFQRTIAKAWRWSGPSAVPASTVAPVVGTGAQGAPPAEQAREHPNLDPERAKALLCDHISNVLGIRIVRFVKFTGKEPTYHMVLAEGGIVEFAHVNKLISQDALRMAIAAAVGKIIRKIKPKEWDPLSQMILDACFIEESDIQQEFVGATEGYVASYLAETGFIESIEGQKVRDQRKPIILSGKVAINASDLQTYVNKTTFQNLSVKAIASMLGAMGGKQIRVRGQKFREQSRWLLPVEKFDPAEYQKEAAEDGR